MDEFQTLNTDFAAIRSVITIHVPIKYPGHSNYEIMIVVNFFRHVRFERAPQSKLSK